MKLFNWFFSEREKNRLIGSGLGNFVQNIYYGEDLSDDSAKNKLLEGVVEITYKGQHNSNGLIITSNGFFLTAYHCISEMISKKEIIYKGKSYKIQKVCAYSKKDDIALGIAKINGACEPIKYKIFDTNHLKESLPVVLISRWNSVSEIKNGFVHNLYDSVSNQFQNNLNVEFCKLNLGDSGGVVADYSGRIIGIISWGLFNGESGESVGVSGGVKIFRAFYIVSFYARKFR